MTDGWMNGWMNGWMDGRTAPYVIAILLLYCRYRFTNSR